MAFTGITATEAQINQKSGANVSSDFTDVMKTASLLLAENWLNAETRRNWSDDYTTLPVDIKGVITSVTASLVAMDAIIYDMGNFTTRLEAQTMLDVLNEVVRKGVKTLKDNKNKTFIDKVT